MTSIDKKKFPEAILGEEKYVDYDEEYDWYGVFGLDSGHCYACFYDKVRAQKWIDDNNHKKEFKK